MSADKYWNEIYSETPFSGGKEPNPFLVQMKPRMQKGKVLDIAMGEGTNAVYLAKEGFSVKAFDISQVAVDHANEYAKEAGVTIEAKRADLDLFLMGIMEYDSIVMTYFKPAITRYYNEIIRALKQGGTFLFESLTQEEMKEVLTPEEAYKNYYYTSNEILKHLRGMRILFYQEGLVSGKHRIQCLAQKPTEKDAARYNLFDMQTKQTESGPSHQRKLAEQFFKKKDE